MSEYEQEQATKRVKTCSDYTSLNVDKSLDDTIKRLENIRDNERQCDEFHDYVDDLIDKNNEHCSKLRKYADVSAGYVSESNFNDPISAWSNSFYIELLGVLDNLTRELAILKRKSYIPVDSMSFDEKIKQLRCIVDVQFTFTQKGFSFLSQ